MSVAVTGTVGLSTTTDSNGRYSFSVPAGGTYTVTPSLAGYTFSPASQTFSNVSGNQTAATASDANAFNITGMWQQASTLAGTWQIRRTGRAQLTDASSGACDLTATNPSAQTDNRGNASAIEQVILAIGNRSASSLDESIFSTGSVTGASSWTRSGSTGAATLSGSPGIPLNGSSVYRVPYCAEGIEYVETVTRRNYQGTIALDGPVLMMLIRAVA